MTMTTNACTWIAGFALATAASAGTPTPVTAPPPSVGLWTWFAGGSVGYLTEMEQPMYSLNLGMEYKRPGAQGSHSIYLQVGYADDDESYSYYPHIVGGPPIAGGILEKSSIDMHIIPITLDYKYQGILSGHLDYYVGLGLGIAVVTTSCDWSWSQSLPPPYGYTSGSDDRTDVRFYGEVFAGLAYHVTDAFEIYAGARYIFMDNADLKVHVNGATYDAGINNNVLLELGLRYRF